MLILGITAVSLVTLASANPWRLAIIKGTSMMPTFRPWSVVAYDTSYYHHHPLQPGDVVILRMGQELWVKRVFAVSGAEFWALKEQLDGRSTSSPLRPEEVERLKRVVRYLQRKRQKAAVVLERIHPEHMFVLGDSLTGIDSRLVGQIPTRNIVGRVFELRGDGTKRKAFRRTWDEYLELSSPLPETALATADQTAEVTGVTGLRYHRIPGRIL